MKSRKASNIFVVPGRKLKTSRQGIEILEYPGSLKPRVVFPPMSVDFSQPANPLRQAAGLGGVVGLHVLLAYALATGLLKDVAKTLQAPLAATLIEAPRPVEPPPPPPPPPPTRKVVAEVPVKAPPPFVPPPEVAVAAPAEPAIAAVSHDPVPPPPPAPPAPAPAPVVEVAVACPNSTQVRQGTEYPRDALRDRITGTVLVQFTVDPDGAVRDLGVVGSANRILAKASLAAARQFRCVGQSQAVAVQVPFVFNIN